jgi:hypothetical protein
LLPGAAASIGVLGTSKANPSIVTGSGVEIRIEEPAGLVIVMIASSFLSSLSRLVPVLGPKSDNPLLRFIVVLPP